MSRANSHFLKCQLSNNHHLAFNLLGNKLGYPILYCHGLPGSRLEAQLACEAATKLGIRIIAVDRPGFGESTFQPNRQMSDWVNDVTKLLQHLEIERFSVMGISGGCPYAMLLGEHLFHRIDKLGLVSGLGNLSDKANVKSIGLVLRAYINLARRFSHTSYFVNRYVTYRFMKLLPQLTMKLALLEGPQIDRDVLKNAKTHDIILNSFMEAIKQDGKGAAWDLYLATKQWQARPENVKTDTYLWHGNLDTTVPPIMAHDHAKRIANCDAKFLANEGHFSLPIRHMDTILATLAP